MDYKYSVQTPFNKGHIIFGGMSEVEDWCARQIGKSNYIKQVSGPDWQLTYRFENRQDAILFSLRWL